MSDGETNEGSVWEAAMSAAHFKLDNLVAVLDYNKLQSDGRSEDIMDIGNLYQKLTILNSPHNYTFLAILLLDTYCHH